jgi:hypothetical protein
LLIKKILLNLQSKTITTKTNKMRITDRILKLIKITEAEKELSYSNGNTATDRHLTLQLRLDFLVSAFENELYK